MSGVVMTVGEFQQGGSFMLYFDDVVKVMKERSFFSEFKKMIEDAGNKIKEKCIIPEEDLKNLHLLENFGFEYDFQKNMITIYANIKNSKTNPYDYERVIILDAEIKEMKELSVFLENQYTKKLGCFQFSFDKDGCNTFIFVLQKKVDKEVWDNKGYDRPEKYFEQMYRELESDLKEIGIKCIDVSKVNDWLEELIVD